MGEGNAFTFHDVNTHGSRIEQHVHDVIVEQIYFVDIKQSAVGIGKHACLEMALAFLDGLFDIQRTDNAVFRGRDRQVYERCGPAVKGQGFPADGAFPAFGAPGTGFIRVAAEAAIIDNL